MGGHLQLLSPKASDSSLVSPHPLFTPTTKTTICIRAHGHYKPSPFATISSITKKQKKKRKTMPAVNSVYIILHHDMSTGSTPLILGVFADLLDANAACLRIASESGAAPPVSNATSATGSSDGDPRPVEPVRWDTLEGESCWVEEHGVSPKGSEAGRGKGI